MKNVFKSTQVLAVIFVLIAGFFGCTKKSDGPTIWIYTSLYNNVVQELTTRLNAKFPGVTFKFYQSGSENVAAKVNSELLAGKTQADLILTSDPFWYEDLKSKQKLLAYDSPNAAKVPSDFKDPENFYTTIRVPVMVIAYHRDSFNAADAPKSFADLTHPRFKNKIAMGSPLESGTVFTTVAMLSKKLGWDYISKLRANGAISSGGNSSVFAKMETKERPVGIVLLENVLAAAKKNPNIVAVFPQEGAVMIPSPVAIMASTPQAELAKKVYDFLHSKEGQEVVVQGNMHAILSDVAPPTGAPEWKTLLSQSMSWSPKLIHEVYQERDQIKKQFSKLMLEE